MKKIVMSLVLLALPSLCAAQTVTSDYFVATDTAATSSFSGNIDVGGLFKTGSATGVASLVNGVLSATTKFIYDPVTNFLGVGTTSASGASTKFAFASETAGTSGANLNLYNYNSGGSSPLAKLGMFGARGTMASPSALQNVDTLGRLVFNGFDGTSFATLAPASIGAIAAENFTPTAHGTFFSFSTTPVGSVTPWERMQITAGGLVNVLYGLNVGSTTTTGSTMFINFGNARILGSISEEGGYLSISTSTTSKILLDSSSGSTGGCIIMKDSDGDGYTYVTANDGVLTATTTPC